MCCCSLLSSSAVCFCIYLIQRMNLLFFVLFEKPISEISYTVLSHFKTHGTFKENCELDGIIANEAFENEKIKFIFK